ncbi:MAG: hypothetical protein DHS20C13_10990 [Thermodesulfobacteriota bacterium]|nr:MAG: hypothetical protein DHS20C13_10990 [Thermodesulfobacteriota bacterium]
MSQKYTDEEIQDLAASYALGVLGDEDKAVFEAMLKENGSASVHLDYFNEIMEDVTYSTEPRKEPRGLEDKLFTKIQKERDVAEKETGYLFVRENQGDWVEVVDGVKVKQLYEDPARKYSTVLVKMDPGSTFPDHVHAEAEECYIIEGELSMGGMTFGKGDYIRADAHSVHESISTVTGCFLLIQASQENEMLPAE